MNITAQQHKDKIDSLQDQVTDLKDSLEHCQYRRGVLNESGFIMIEALNTLRALSEENAAIVDQALLDVSEVR